MIEKFYYGLLNKVYGYDDYTQQEINAKLIQKIDEVIEVCNNAFEFMDYIKGEGLTDEVVNTLNAWKEDGTLENLNNQKEINDLRTELNVSIDELKQRIEKLEGYHTTTQNGVN